MALALADGGGELPTNKLLTGCSILIVEDEYLIARDIGSAVTASGGEVVGLCPDLPTALDLIDTLQPLHGAVIDINLRGIRAFALADALRKRGIGFVIATGYDVNILPRALADAPRCVKPIDYGQLVAMLHDEIGP